jgi:(S)-citramalyl-CoA lyase
MADAAAFASLLFVPGDRPDRIAKAFATDADRVCIDLEDAVGPDAKDGARRDVLALLPTLDPARAMLRINALTSADGLRDLLALAEATTLPATIMLPKTGGAGDIAILSSMLGDRARLIALVETIEGLDAVEAIAAAPGVAGVMLGVADLSAELGCALAWEPLLGARIALVKACAHAGVLPIDGPHVDLTDHDGGADEARRSHALGFRSKAAIHPAQLPGIHAAFRPTPDRIAHARRAVAAFEASGGRATRFEGRLLEAPIVRQLRQVAAFERIDA